MTGLYILLMAEAIFASILVLHVFHLSNKLLILREEKFHREVILPMVEKLENELMKK